MNKHIIEKQKQKLLFLIFLIIAFNIFFFLIFHNNDKEIKYTEKTTTIDRDKKEKMTK